LAGYYKRFIKDFSNIAPPLTNMLKKMTKFEWSDKYEEAFQELKVGLSNRTGRVEFIFVLHLNGLRNPHLNLTYLLNGLKTLSCTHLIGLKFTHYHLI